MHETTPYFVLTCSFNSSTLILLSMTLYKNYTLFFVTAIVVAISGNAQQIQINQLGYGIDAPKIAAVTNMEKGSRFYLTSLNYGDTVYSGVLLPAHTDTYANQMPVQLADFSTFQQPGVYHLLVPGAQNQPIVYIQSQPFYAVGKALIKGFYYQRASMPLLPAYAGMWRREAGHPDTAVFIHSSAATAQRPVGSVIVTPGGWYDAGDYNKYIVNSGITVYTLLNAYSNFSPYFDTLHLYIPESNNTLPDLLDEVLYNLRWMLTMQDTDGGVYHKCTNAAFDGMIMPNAAMQPRYVVQKSTAATLDFAAVMAQASRIFAQWNQVLPGLSDSCKKAAIHAWQWAEGHPNIDYNQVQMNAKFKPAITTGAYGDTQLLDEWFWAAAELAITTEDAVYIHWLLQYKVPPVTIPSWNRVAALGMYSLLDNRRLLPQKLGLLADSLYRVLIQNADALLHHANGAMHTVMGQCADDFIWGSNAVAANQGIWLLHAFMLTGQRRYLNGALSNADYLLGRNASGYCYVTGFGVKSPMHPHHRPSIADGIEPPVPGLLVGGPNPGKQDGQAYPNIFPETAYTDNDKAYACNEIAINWNAPAVYLLNGLNYLATQGVWGK